MSTVASPRPRRVPRPLVEPFPPPQGQSLVLAFRELDLAMNGTAEQRRSLGDITLLPKPWIPATCTAPVLRAEVWTWLEQVVTWLNDQLVFESADTIAACWPRHPHLVHEIAVLADLRRRADISLTSDLLEEWHRYALPAFLDRMKHRVGDYCNQTHAEPRPAAGRLSRHLGDQASDDRREAFVDDINAIRDVGEADGLSAQAPRLCVVDQWSGELLD